MFGYTLPLYSTMSATDVAIYQRYYCETCHHLKSVFGVVSTSVVSYDMTFNTIILNSIAGEVLDFDSTKKSILCVFNDPKAVSDLMDKMAGYTILLAKWEIIDDKTDKPTMKTNAADLTLGKAIRKAEKLYPEYDEAVAKGFAGLRDLELRNETDPILIGKAFGKALAVPLCDIAGKHSNDELNELFTDLTTMIYVMDAVDDLDDDYMDETYNPYLTNCEDFTNKKRFIEQNIYSITSTMNTVMGELQSSYSLVKENMRTAKGVTDNIVYYGLPGVAKRILSGENNNTKPTVSNLINAHQQRNASR